MRKLLGPQTVTYSGHPRLVVAIDAAAGQVELAPRTNVRDISAGGAPTDPGLQYPGGRSVPGDIVRVDECDPRPDQSPDWPWATI